jgi:hypothetical protein
MSPTKVAATSSPVTIVTPESVQAEIASMVAEVASTKKGVSVMSKNAPQVGIYAFAERTGPQGGVKPVGVGAGITIPGKKPMYFYNVASVTAMLDTFGAPKDTPVAKSLLGAARAVEAFITSSKPKKGAAIAPKSANF